MDSNSGRIAPDRSKFVLRLSRRERLGAMQQFRAGQRPATVMDRIAKGFSDDEAAAIAAWYAGQKE